MDVRLVARDDFATAMELLEQSSRGGEPMPPDFAGAMCEEVEKGTVELLVARLNGLAVGVAFLSFRPNISAGNRFASIEELYVKPTFRRKGVGRALLAAAEQRCALKTVSYVEVQAAEKGAIAFYRASGYEMDSEVRILYLSVPLW